MTARAHFIKKLSEEFRQLQLYIGEGDKHEEEYRAIVLRGEGPKIEESDFKMDVHDTLEILKGEFGQVRCIFLRERDDFIRMVRCMAHRCTPWNVPRSMGSIVIMGITNWRKIQEHKIRFLSEGGEDWRDEFKRFTSVKENFKDDMIIISEGSYSGVDVKGEELGGMDWIEISRGIRKYHELTHLICFKKHREKREPIFDEILADIMGMYISMGQVKKEIILRCLGIEGNRYRDGGRLENYIPRVKITKEVCRAVEECYSSILSQISGQMQGISDGEAICELERLIEDVYMSGVVDTSMERFKKFH